MLDGNRWPNDLGEKLIVVLSGSAAELTPQFVGQLACMTRGHRGVRRVEQGLGIEERAVEVEDDGLGPDRHYADAPSGFASAAFFPFFTCTSPFEMGW
jgi:hypothetical protein